MNVSKVAFFTPAAVPGIWRFRRTRSSSSDRQSPRRTPTRTSRPCGLSWPTSCDRPTRSSATPGRVRTAPARLHRGLRGGDFRDFFGFGIGVPGFSETSGLLNGALRYNYRTRFHPWSAATNTVVMMLTGTLIFVSNCLPYLVLLHSIVNEMPSVLTSV